MSNILQLDVSPEGTDNDIFVSVLLLGYVKTYKGKHVYQIDWYGKGEGKKISAVLPAGHFVLKYIETFDGISRTVVKVFKIKVGNTSVIFDLQAGICMLTHKDILAYIKHLKFIYTLT